MKTSVGTFALIGAVLLAGAALAQTPPQPRGGPTVAAGPRTTAPPTSGGESGSENGQTRAIVNSSGGVIAAETSTPVNGIGGTGGGRFTFVSPGRRTTAPPTPGGESGSENGETRATVNSSGGHIDIESWSWGRIDRVNTAEACTARRGEVVMHQGVRQCRLPATTRRDEPNVTMHDFSITR
ncbi:hypothetical protein [Brevundimonas sp.]|uniref:hypothetical protein n=1 Tax=Brevundimonas sp. TaxID=1871086 RepID=UPI003F72172A